VTQGDGSNRPLVFPADGDQVTYMVKARDTLSEIALQYQTNYQAIAELNNLTNPHLIFPGQTFVIPAK